MPPILAPPDEHRAAQQSHDARFARVRGETSRPTDPARLDDAGPAPESGRTGARRLRRLAAIVPARDYRDVTG
jgi:hypothetical protein